MIGPALHGRLTNASSQYFRYWFLFWHFVDGFLPIRFTSGWSHSDDHLYTDEWKSHSPHQIQKKFFFLRWWRPSCLCATGWLTERKTSGSSENEHLDYNLTNFFKHLKTNTWIIKQTSLDSESTLLYHHWKKVLCIWNTRRIESPKQMIQPVWNLIYRITPSKW